MANDNNDISDIVKKCKILLLDIEGTTTSISFVKDKLFPYAEENVKVFLDTQWESEDVKEAVSALRKLAIEDQEKSLDGVIAIPGEDASKEDQIEGLVKSVKWQMSSDRKVGALKSLQGLIWKQGYDKGDLKGHVYDDVAPAIELWRSVEGRKVYIYSSGSVAAQKLLFGLSSAGDLLPSIDGHFDTNVGAKQEAASYTAIAEKIGCKPDEILFLTDILKEAEAARSSGAHAALVSREGNAPLAEGAAAFPRLHSLAQLAATNKRKPDPQDEQPAKVPKTDIDADVKSNSDTEKSPETVADKPAEGAEKMEVEEEVVTKDEADKSASAVEPIDKVDTIVEDVTDMSNVKDMPVCDAEPIIEESVDKTDKIDTEKMDTESHENKDSDSPPKDEAKENGEKAPVAEETPPTVITEITDITNDKESLSEVTEIIEDLEPVIEEPPAAQDMEDLQNVGEVLEKECDEILSKVQDVTNLDNIPLKPLQTIAEETMETENSDTNDIVERILDSEQENEMKQCGDSDLNSVAADDKGAIEEGKGDTIEAAADVPEVVEEKLTEKIKETTKEDLKDTPAGEVKESSVDNVKDSSTEKENNIAVKEKLSGAENIEDNTRDKVESVPSERVEEKTEKIATDNIVKEIKTNEDKSENISSTESQAKETTTSTIEKQVDNVTKDEKMEHNQVEKELSKAGAKESTVNTDTEMMEAKTSTDKADVSKEPETSKADIETDEATTATTSTSAETSDSKLDTAQKKTEEKETLEAEQSQVKNKESRTEVSTMETDPPAETKAAESTAAVKSDEPKAQVNGKTNGDAEMTDLNGDDLSSRLSMENGKEVNGANGESGAEHPDFKVKSVAADERTDPVELPTEA